MNHARFKMSQTAALYVANGLDPQTQEAFELHLLECPECVEDVETWRAIKRHIPKDAVRSKPAETARSGPSFGWRIAASVSAATLIGSAVGWHVRSLQETRLVDEQTAFFSLPARTRGAEECMSVHYTADTRRVVLRVPGVPSGSRAVATDAQGVELASGRYAARLQADGSWILSFDPQALSGNRVHIDARGADGSAEPLACVTGQPST
jgi:anti-sigma factor RsiW